MKLSKINKVKTVKTVKDYLKEKQKAAHEAQKLAKEMRFQEYLSKTSKAILPSNLKVQLKVIDSDVYVSTQSQLNQALGTSGRDSIWAPWSNMVKR